MSNTKKRGIAYLGAAILLLLVVYLTSSIHNEVTDHSDRTQQFGTTMLQSILLVGTILFTVGLVIEAAYSLFTANQSLSQRRGDAKEEEK